MKLTLIGLKSTRYRPNDAGVGTVELCEVVTAEHLEVRRSPLRVTLTGDAKFAEQFCPDGDLDPRGLEVDLELTVRRVSS